MGESNSGAEDALRRIPGGVRFPAKIHGIHFYCFITTHALMLLPGDPRPVQKFIENQRIIRRITAKKVTQLTVPLSKETLICIMPEDIQGELLKDNTRE